MLSAMLQGVEIFSVGLLSGGLIGGASLSAIFYRRLRKQLQKQNYQINTIEQLYNELQRSSTAVDESYLGTIESLVLALEARDTYTAGHSERVNKYSVAIARKLGLSSEEIELIHHGSLLHDIGKIGVYDRILLKPKALDIEELSLMQEHPEHGVKILANTPALKKHLPIILHHHERQDGSGYPHKLKGEQIPIGARIVQVADTWDAMRSDRPYRRKLELKIAISQMEQAAGTQLDPDCVKAFLESLHPKTGSLLPKTLSERTATKPSSFHGL